MKPDKVRVTLIRIKTGWKALAYNYSNNNIILRELCLSFVTTFEKMDRLYIDTVKGNKKYDLTVFEACTDMLIDDAKKILLSVKENTELHDIFSRFYKEVNELKTDHCDLYE